MPRIDYDEDDYDDDDSRRRYAGLASSAAHLGIGGDRPRPGLPDSLHALSEQPGQRAFRPVAVAAADARLCAAVAVVHGPGDGCANAQDRTRLGLLSRRRCRLASRQLRAQRRSLADREPRLPGCRRRHRPEPHRGHAVGWTRRQRARRRAQARDQVGQARCRAHRDLVRPEAGRTAPGAHRGSARTAGDRPAVGRGPRLRPPPRHRPRRHAARGLRQREVGRGQAGREHADPAARAQRPARHRQGTDAVAQVQRDPVRAADRGALRQAHHPRGLFQPGLPRPARRAGDPRRRRRLGVLVRPRPARPQHRADRAA